jgi:hypothetical protein
MLLHAGTVSNGNIDFDKNVGLSSISFEKLGSSLLYFFQYVGVKRIDSDYECFLAHFHAPHLIEKSRSRPVLSF